MLCLSCIQPKKQFKVQIIGMLEEIDAFYWPKMHLRKGDKKFGQNPKEQQLFFVIPSLELKKNGNWKLIVTAWRQQCLNRLNNILQITLSLATWGNPEIIIKKVVQHWRKKNTKLQIFFLLWIWSPEIFLIAKTDDKY